MTNLVTSKFTAKGSYMVWKYRCISVELLIAAQNLYTTFLDVMT